MLTVARTTFRDIEKEAAGCDITLPIEDYLDMIGALGAEHSRVFAARIDGQEWPGPSLQWKARMRCTIMPPCATPPCVFM